MRQLKRSVGLVAFACVFALFAAPAMAAEFNASLSGKTRGKNAEETEQMFKFGGVKIVCAKANQTGEVLAGKHKVLFDKVKFGKCLTEAKLGGNPIFLTTKFLTPIDFEYHANGFAEVGGSSESELKLTAPSSIELKIPSIKCIIELPAQTVPVKAEKHPEEEFSAVLFSTTEVEATNLKKFPTGFQKKLLIENQIKNLKYAFTEGQCSEFTKTEGKAGQYIGALLDELVGGNLSYE